MLYCLRLRNKNRLSQIIRNHANYFHSLPQNAHSSKYKQIYLTQQRCIHHSLGNSATAAADSVNQSQYDSNALPKNAKTVICGGGIMGAAVAYHLALQGLGPETVLLEQDKLVH